jgi:hypothetical protein
MKGKELERMQCSILQCLGNGRRRADAGRVGGIPEVSDIIKV